MNVIPAVSDNLFYFILLEVLVLKSKCYCLLLIKLISLQDLSFEVRGKVHFKYFTIKIYEKINKIAQLEQN